MQALSTLSWLTANLRIDLLGSQDAYDTIPAELNLKPMQELFMPDSCGMVKIMLSPILKENEAFTEMYIEFPAAYAILPV